MTETSWALRPADAADFEMIAELKKTVLRADLIRLGRYDEDRVRQRLRDSFDPRYASLVVVRDEVAGCVTVRPGHDCLWLEHFYLAPRHQGRGLGTAILRTVLARADAQRLPVRLVVFQGSAARRLYERHGFRLEREDPVDAVLVRQPAACSA